MIKSAFDTFPLSKTAQLILGTWRFGDSHWPQLAQGTAEEILRTAYSRGVKFFDTAEGYARGGSEELLGRTFEEVREQLFFISKVAPNHLHFSALIDSCHRSLRRLKTDYLDLYLVHWPSGSFGTKVVPVEETCQALQRLLEQQKVCSVGLSNVSLAQLIEYRKYIPVSAVQNCYSLLWPKDARDVIPYCMENRIAYMAYSPLGQGFLAGRRLESIEMTHDIRRKNTIFQQQEDPYVAAVTSLIEQEARAAAMSPAALSLACLFSQNVSPVCGVSSVEQLMENLASSSERVQKLANQIQQLLPNPETAGSWSSNHFWQQ